MHKLSLLSDLHGDKPLYICPACNAGEKLYHLIRKHRPDIHVLGFLDNYKETKRAGLPIRLIASDWDRESCNVVVAMEREDIRNSLLKDLETRNIEELTWIDSLFSAQYANRSDAGAKRLCFVYDLRVNPLNYEFVVSLCHADIERRLRNCDVLDVVIVKQDEHELFDISRNAISEVGNVVESDNDWFMQNVILPSCALIPSVDGVSVIRELATVDTIVSRTPSENVFPNNYATDNPVEIKSARRVFEETYSRNGGHDLPIKAPDSAHHFVRQWLEKQGYENKRIVVITLREAGYQVERNSVKTVWKSFADYLFEHDFVPVFVRDTFADFLDDDFSAYPVFHEASWNVLLRVAFYEQAYMNMLVNTGPAAFCVFNRRAPYVLFNHVASEGYVGSQKYHTESGSPVGSQYAARMPYQHAVWGGSDSYEVIVSEFEKACGCLSVSSDRDKVGDR